MEVIILSILVSVITCKFFMYWYEKMLDCHIRALINEIQKIAIEAIEEAKSHKL